MLSAKTSMSEWERVIGINLTGSFLAIRTLASHFREGSSTVNISSSAELTGTSVPHTARANGRSADRLDRRRWNSPLVGYE